MIIVRETECFVITLDIFFVLNKLNSFSKIIFESDIIVSKGR